MKMKIKHLIIDGTNIGFRYYYVTRKDKVNNAHGKPIEIMNKYIEGLKLLIRTFEPEKIYATFDKRLLSGKTNYRQELLGGTYKGNREKPDDVEELYDQEARLVHIFRSLGINVIFPNVLEADDVVAYLSNKLDGNNIIVSVDQDLLQLINERTSVWNLKTLITIDNFEDIVGVSLENYILYKAIKGDDGDNIDGLPGYGKVRASRLAKLWKTSTILPEYRNIVERNIKLVDLSYGLLNETGEIESYDKQFKENELRCSNRDEFIKHCTNEGIKINISDWNHFFNSNNLVNMINSISDKYLKGV